MCRIPPGRNALSTCWLRLSGKCPFQNRAHPGAPTSPAAIHPRTRHRAINRSRRRSEMPRMRSVCGLLVRTGDRYPPVKRTHRERTSKRTGNKDAIGCSVWEASAASIRTGCTAQPGTFQQWSDTVCRTMQITERTTVHRKRDSFRLTRQNSREPPRSKVQFPTSILQQRRKVFNHDQNLRSK